MTLRKCRILIADDHLLIQEGIISWLNSDQRFEVVGKIRDGKHVLPMALKYHPLSQSSWLPLIRSISKKMSRPWIGSMRYPSFEGRAMREVSTALPRYTSDNQCKNAPIAGKLMAALIDYFEAGNDHDHKPMRLRLPYIQHEINVGFYSRRRPIYQESSFSVLG